MARKLAAVAFSLGCLHASSLMALGLGEIKLESFLNEPLKASIDLLNMGGLHPEEIKIRLGTSDDFDKLGLDRAYFLTSIKFEVAGNDSGGARIVISSEEAVLEPYLDFIVEARWPSGRLLREYTVLVDPPVFSQGAQVVSASQRVEEVEGIAAPAKKNREVAASGTSVNEEDATIGNWGAEQGSSRGTRVDVRESNLAPGSMPKRRYNAATSPAPTPGSRYMIGRDQTLWGIASRAKPAGASVHQTMLDIQRLNPDAFINGNINKIKAGYIIYLPGAGDISSADVSTALAEVREQNAAWREGRDVHPTAAKRPSLRISAEPEEAAEPAGAKAPAPGTNTPLASVETPPASSTAAAPVVSTTSPAPADAQERLAAIEEQLATLQRIVSLKDDQIAALQGALANAGVVAGEKGATDAVSNVGDAPVAPATAPVPAANGTVAENSGVTVPGAAPEPNALPTGDTRTAAPEPANAESAKTPPATASGNDWMSYLLYILGALVLAGAGFVFSRRRGGEEQDTVTARHTATKDDVFSDVQLKHQSINVEAPEQDIDELPASARDNRGYGERKHDEYASDIDAADALAEADIYIAYGRHQQAIDLLNNALATEPDNPVYRLKLLEIYTERNNHAAAAAQLAKIRSIGDADSIARAESLMDSLEGRAEPKPELPKASVSTPAESGLRLPPNPLEMMPDSKESLDEKFSGLEIEGRATSSDDDDLDLSGDFATGRATGYEDEELVIAADSNGLSTKLDLARAYLDMGDDDGARQILDEVVAEGSEELKAEARALLDRIGG
jgi:pilus assembly protein FimV